MSSSAIPTSTANKLVHSKLTVDESTVNTPLGRGLAATENIPAGSPLLSIDLIRAISVLDNVLFHKTCSTCFKNSKDADPVYGKKLLACNSCRVLRYCSKECQADDWQVHHRKECKYLQRVSDVPDPLTRGVMRLFSLMSGEGANGPFAQDVSKLLSHIQQFKQNAKWWAGITQTTNDIKHIFAAGRKPLDAAGVNRVEQLYSINSFALGSILSNINSHTLADATSERMGRIFDPTLALLNHSCNPNAALIYDGNIVHLRSIRGIRSGEQVTISYIDTTHIRPARQGHLQMNYFFKCTCPACEPPNRHFSVRDSYVCDNPTCKALIPSPYLPNNFSCPTCNKLQSMTVRQLQTLELTALGVLDKNLLAKDNLGRLLNTTLIPALKTLTSCPSWPVLRQPAPGLRKLILDIAESTADFYLAFEHSTALSSLPLIDLHPEPFHPSKPVQAYKTGMLLAMLGTMQNDEDYLARAKAVLEATEGLAKRSHGVGSEFVSRIADRIRDVAGEGR